MKDIKSFLIGFLSCICLSLFYGAKLYTDPVTGDNFLCSDHECLIDEIVNNQNMLYEIKRTMDEWERNGIKTRDW